jgi:hypothetical protein
LEKIKIASPNPSEGGEKKRNLQFGSGKIDELRKTQSRLFKASPFGGGLEGA